MEKEVKIISRVVPRKGDGNVSAKSITKIIEGGGASVVNAKHADKATTLDENTPVLDWFLSALNDDEAQGVINFLKGIKIAGDLFSRIVKKDDEGVEYDDTDVMSALRVMKEIESNADKLKDIFLRKDINDSTKFLLTFYAGAVFGKNGFASGLTGFGAKVFDNGHAEFESAFIRRFLEVPELRYNRVTVTLGDKWRAPGAGIIETVDTATKTCTLKLEDGEIGAVSAGDICMGIYHNTTGNATEDYDDGKGNRKFAGFCTVYFTITEVLGERNEIFKYQLRPESSSWPYSFDPFEMMTFVSYGNFTNKDRQTSVYETRTYTRMLWKQNTWEISAANTAMQYGDLSNLNVFGLVMDGYSMYVNNVYFTGTINRVKPDGTPIRDLNFRQEFIPGTHYDYYDSVTYDGSTWACVNEDGTSAVPGSNNDWLNIASKGNSGPQGVPGDKGADGDSVSNLGHWHTGLHVPYMGIVRMGSGSYQCTVKAGTDNPPLWCWTDNGSNRFTYSDGSYCLTGEINTAEYTLIAEDGVDGKDGEDGVSVSNVDVMYAISDSNTTAPTNGWQTTAPAWQNGKYIWTKTIVDYGDGTKGESDPVCISGGKGIKKIVEYYYKSTSNTTQVGGSWTETYPGWENGTYIWTKSRITYTDETTEETTPACVTGAKGEGYTQMGQFKTGMVVPKMGVVTMGGGSYVAKVATTNPPLWCWTDNSGNRFTYSDGGYCLTGEVNTAEYDVWAQKGDTGDKGDKGDKGDTGDAGSKGEQGIQGCIIRHSEWSNSGVVYRNDEALTSGTRYLDIAMKRNDGNVDGWDVYKCLQTHTSSASNGPGNASYWEKLSSVGPIYTSLIIAKNASIDFMQGNELLIKNANNAVVAGMTGGASTSAGTTPIRIWAGAQNPSDAPFRVDEEGGLTATKANISGVVNANLFYSKASDMDSLADGNGSFTVNPSTHGVKFFSADGLGGTITLPSAASWNGISLKFVVDMTSRVAKNPDKYKSPNYFCGLVGRYSNKMIIELARPYILELEAFNNNWYVTRMDSLNLNG